MDLKMSTCPTSYKKLKHIFHQQWNISPCLSSFIFSIFVDHHFGSDWNISSTVCAIAMKIGRKISEQFVSDYKKDVTHKNKYISMGINLEMMSGTSH